MSRYSKTKLRTGQTLPDTPKKQPPPPSVGSAISAEEEQFLLGGLQAEAAPTKKAPTDRKPGR